MRNTYTYLGTYLDAHESQPVILNPNALGPILRLPMALMVVCLLVVHMIIWGVDSLDSLFMDLNVVLGVLVTYVVGTALHEALLLLGYRVFGRATRTALSISLHGLIAYAHCDAPISVQAYRAAVALPGLVLGIVPLLIGLATGNVWFTYFGALMSAGALGDMRVLATLRKLPASRLLVLR